MYIYIYIYNRCISNQVMFLLLIVAEASLIPRLSSYYFGNRICGNFRRNCFSNVYKLNAFHDK